MRVATFNIRFDPADLASSEDANGWLNEDNPRRERVLQTIRSLDVDVLGVQEALPNQVADLQEELTDYAFVGVGREDGDMEGEYAGIFFRSARFTAVASGHFWLSTTPEVPGTVFEGSNNTRMASWVRLLDSVAEREFVFLNTHWDHVSTSSRERSAALIRDRLRDIAGDAPVILAGDLNEPPEGGAIAILLAEGPQGTAPMYDHYREFHPTPSGNEGTYHAFTGVDLLRIDFLFHTDGLTTLRASIERPQFDGLYPSDHHPVTGVMGWARTMEGALCPR